MFTEDKTSIFHFDFLKLKISAIIKHNHLKTSLLILDIRRKRKVSQMFSVLVFIS